MLQRPQFVWISLHHLHDLSHKFIIPLFDLHAMDHIHGIADLGLPEGPHGIENFVHVGHSKDIYFEQIKLFRQNLVRGG